MYAIFYKDINFADTPDREIADYYIDEIIKDSKNKIVIKEYGASDKKLEIKNSKRRDFSIKKVIYNYEDYPK